LRYEYDREDPDLLHVYFPRGTGTDYIEVWDDDEARVLLQEPFERYEGLDGFKGSWSAADRIIECNVIWVNTRIDSDQPSHGVVQRLDTLGLQASFLGRINSQQRVEIESDQGLSVSLGPCSTLHGTLHYEDFLDPEVYTASSQPLTVRIRGTGVKSHAAATDLLEQVEGTDLSRIGSTVGVPLALERTVRRSAPEQGLGRTVMLPIETSLFWGKTVGVTGRDPYDELALKKIVSLEGGLVGDADIWQTNQLIIVGREAFDKNYLRRSIEFGLEQGFVCRYLSQEDFWHFWLGGEETTYYAGDPRIARHAGLSFIASVGFRWPSIEAVQGVGGTGRLSERMNEEHLLKSRFGYSVALGTTVEERRRKLDRAVTGPGALGLENVVKHIAGLVNRNRLRHDNRMLDAIEKWEADLDWLYRTYYDGHAYSFVWPETR